ncbi:MAG: OmpA family protein, partial [Crocinitomicaceae bacterium]|nr:OmpA family protein [Crocinitomicaceae bacterium]
DNFTVNKTRIEIRDIESGDLVITSIRLLGMTDLEGGYRASDLIFAPSKSGTLKIQCSQDEYFFVDRNEDVNPKDNKIIQIYFQWLLKGKSLQLEDIAFNTNSSELFESAEPVLIRLREFLTLNADINVEIQGHVFKQGKTTADGMAVSEARAKRIMNYLISYEIDRKRLTAFG